MSIGKLRPIPPDLWTDEDLIALPLPVKWTAVALRMHADDHGRETVTDWMLRPSLWPGDPITADDLVEHLLMLDEVGYVGLYSDERRTYYQVRDWPSVSHPRDSRHPAPPPDLFQRFAGGSPAARSAWEGDGERGSSGDRERPASVPPSPFCRVHQPNGTEEDCRHCGTARLANQQWLAEERAGVHHPDQW